MHKVPVGFRNVALFSKERLTKDFYGSEEEREVGRERQRVSPKRIQGAGLGRGLRSIFDRRRFALGAFIFPVCRGRREYIIIGIYA